MADTARVTALLREIEALALSHTNNGDWRDVLDDTRAALRELEGAEGIDVYEVQQGNPQFSTNFEVINRRTGARLAHSLTLTSAQQIAHSLNRLPRLERAARKVVRDVEGRTTRANDALDALSAALDEDPT